MCVRRGGACARARVCVCRFIFLLFREHATVNTVKNIQCDTAASVYGSKGALNGLDAWLFGCRERCELDFADSRSPICASDERSGGKSGASGEAFLMNFYEFELWPDFDRPRVPSFDHCGSPRSLRESLTFSVKISVITKSLTVRKWHKRCCLDERNKSKQMIISYRADTSRLQKRRELNWLCLWSPVGLSKIERKTSTRNTLHDTISGLDIENAAQRRGRPSFNNSRSRCTFVSKVSALQIDKNSP